MPFADAEYAGKRKQTRKKLYLIEMDLVVPRRDLIALIEHHYPCGEGGRPAYPLMAMLRIYLMQSCSVLLNGTESAVCADVGYTGIENARSTWRVAKSSDRLQPRAAPAKNTANAARRDLLSSAEGVCP